MVSLLCALVCSMVSRFVGPPLYKLKRFLPCAALQQDDLASVFPLLADRCEETLLRVFGSFVLGCCGIIAVQPGRIQCN